MQCAWADFYRADAAVKIRRYELHAALAREMTRLFFMVKQAASSVMADLDCLLRQRLRPYTEIGCVINQ